MRIFWTPCTSSDNGSGNAALYGLLGECRALRGSPDKLTYCMLIINHSLSDAGGGACDVANCRSSLTVCSFKFPVPRPAFRHLPYCKRRTASNEKLSVGQSVNKATLYLRGVPQVAERISPSS